MSHECTRRTTGGVWLGTAVLAMLAILPVTGRAANAIFASGFEPPRPVPMSLISRGKPAVASAGNAAAVVDGGYSGGVSWDAVPSAATPAWVAIHVGAGATQAMLNWVALPNTVLPANYRIETSADSTTGANGTWTTAVAVTGNTVPARAHSFAFVGKQWVRFVVTQAQTPGQGISINEIDVHDASAGTSDSWMFIGDSITALAFARSLFDGNFPERVHAATPDFFPLMIGAGAGGTSTTDAVAHIDEWIALHPEMRNWVVSYGTNDAASLDPIFAPAFGNRLRVIVGKLQAAGKRVFVPRIPYRTGGEAYLGAYNAQVDAVCSEFALDAAPDLYAWFIAHQSQLADGVHPTEVGERAMNQLWADAVRPLYP